MWLSAHNQASSQYLSRPLCIRTSDRSETMEGIPCFCFLSQSFFLIFYYCYYFLLYNIVLVLPYINMHPPRVYTCSPSWTPLPPPSPYHPSGSSQCTSPKLLVSCIKPGLAIHILYDIVHSKDLIQIWRRNQKLFRQAKAERISTTKPALQQILKDIL